MRQHYPLRLAARAAAQTLLAGSLLVAAAPLEAAANREHQQMMADIRMLQEQNQQLHQTLGTLVDALKAVTTKIDEQSATTPQGRRRPEAAHRRPRHRAAHRPREARRLERAPRIVVARKSIRCGTRCRPCPSAADAVDQPGRHDTGARRIPRRPRLLAPRRSRNGAAAPAPACRRRRCSTSPTRTTPPASGALAISGFETYLRAFPQAPQADDAQFYIGESFQLDGKIKEAVAAYEKVIADFPTGDRVPDALYKRGVVFSALNQPDKARASFEATFQKVPDSAASRLAKQQLDKVGRRD